MLYFSYQTYSSQKKNSAFVIYGRAFIENINNNRKLLCFLGKHHNLEFLEFELRDYKSYSRSPSYDRILCLKSCEMWNETRWIYKSIQFKYICQDVYSSVLVFQSFKNCLVSETLSIWNHSNEIITKNCWKGNGYCPAFLCLTWWSSPGIFFIQTHTLVA